MKFNVFCWVVFRFSDDGGFLMMASSLGLTLMGFRLGVMLLGRVHSAWAFRCWGFALVVGVGWRLGMFLSIKCFFDGVAGGIDMCDSLWFGWVWGGRW